MAPHAALSHFHPRVAQWFAARYAAPTDAQVRAWPVIATGQHTLITAPTGSGKTLTAFLWALDQLITGRYESGRTRVLYVSPLKALNTDIRRNLEAPLAELTAAFAAAGEPFPQIRVQTRSGDTPAGERAAMLRRPPEILITTPESLNLLLTSQASRNGLAGVQAVILDEVHDLVPNRRGVQLITAVERLALIAGEFQRIALSATVRPLEAVGAWVAGHRLTHQGASARHEPRAITLVQARDEKHIDVCVELPPAAVPAMDSGEKIWVPIAAALRDIAAHNRATLIFTNNRRLAEQITMLINEGQDEPIAYAHHGSLSREIRTAVEQRLKNGELKAIVATSSLEMGIDIGELDEVVMLQSPPTIAATIQRTGRAGHQVGAVSHGRLIATHGHDFLQAAALVEAVAARDIEAVQPMEGALDVLAQQLISMTAQDTWDIDRLYDAVRCASPYRHLSRERFDLVLEMLAGRYASTRIRSLDTRVSIDRGANTVHARRGAVLSLYTAGGSIPNRGYFALRHAQTNAPIGELDEEFVWEAKVNQIFALGTQQWRIQQITHDDVFVVPAQAAGAPPFWKAEGNNRSHHLSLRIGDVLERFETALAQRGGAAQLRATLESTFAFNATAAEQLADHLERQRTITNRALPHRNHLLIEHIASGPGGYQAPNGGRQVVLHTMWGGRVNRPLALAMGIAWRQKWGTAPQIQAGNDTIAFESSEDIDGASLLSLVDSHSLESWLRPALESSSFFGARFRECAGRALLLAPRRFNRRQPLWMTRQAAKDLLEAIADKPDFPMLLEAWRTCLVDEFDLPGLRARLDELGDRAVAWDECATAVPSPFAGQITFSQIVPLMYADDTPQLQGPSGLADNLIRDVARHASLRPQIAVEFVADYERRRQRLQAGWAPSDATELVDWLRERVWLTEQQWGELSVAVRRDAGTGADDALREAGLKLVWLVHADGRRFVAAADTGATIAAAAGPDIAVYGMASGELVAAQPLRRDDSRTATALIGEAIAFFGPRPHEAIAAWSPFTAPQLEAALQALIADGRIIRGQLTGDMETLCDGPGLEALLRMQRAQRRAQLEPLAVQRLPDFLAAWQKFGADVDTALQSLVGLRAPVALFESDLLPARVPAYAPHLLDELLREERWLWVATQAGEILMVDGAHLDLVQPEPSGPVPAFADARARYDFFTLADQQAEPIAVFSRVFWEGVWGARITSSDFAPLREGLARDFVLPEGAGNTPAHGNGAAMGPDRELARQPAWQQARQQARPLARQRARGWPGVWRLLPPPAAGGGDALHDLERDKALVRLLLGRYGVLCRDLLAREQAPFVWRELFRALRLMELAGEVIAGHFFADLSVPQFADPAALRLLERPASGQVFWCSALDPISPCGLPGVWPAKLPRRALGNHVGFRGATVTMISEARGRRLQLLLAPDDPDILACFAPLESLLTRTSGRMDRIEVATINDAPAPASHYLAALRRVFDVLVDHRMVTLRRRFPL